MIFTAKPLSAIDSIADSVTASVTGIAVSPSKLEFSEIDLEKQLRIFNLGNYAIHFRIEDENNFFTYSFKNDSINANSKSDVFVRLKKIKLEEIKTSGESKINIFFYASERDEDGDEIFHLMPAISIRAVMAQNGTEDRAAETGIKTGKAGIKAAGAEINKNVERASNDFEERNLIGEIGKKGKGGESPLLGSLITALIVISGTLAYALFRRRPF